ncbi:esterase family protein [Mangrovimonas sp. TPBH4]|uniref:alpha/beta hydrolase n=1 Tax=Mangrovimonas sp. TPBH4 TaxID=1645914 RepID=UPI0006B4DD58|nr:alpha/beta hydrolase-fold protein [Mangrovimonas sp. TPBH4]
MKKLTPFALVLLVLMAFLNCETEPVNSDFDNVQTEDSYRKIEKSKLQNRVLESEALYGNFIGNSYVRKLQIYTPPGYKKNGTKEYPVVYLLHGFPFSEKSFIDESVWDEWINNPYLFSNEYPDFPEEGFRLWIDSLISNGLIEPMIIVMPNAATEPYGFSFYTNSILNGNFEDFIVDDLVSYMDKNYSTIANPTGRAVVGHSQGGYAAFKFGMLHPDIFGVVGSHSGLLLVDALLEFAAVIEQENPNGFTGPDSSKFLTSAMYAMSAAWSPNLNNPPYYVDLPFEFDEYGSVHPVMEVMDRWHQQDVFSMLDIYYDNFNSLNGIYFDVGIYDELGTNLTHPYIVEKLNFYNIDYTFETYEGGHHTNMFERLAIALEFCSNKF